VSVSEIGSGRSLKESRVYERQEPSSTFYTEQNKPSLISRLDKLEGDVRGELRGQGFEESRIHVERALNMRFEGTDTALMVLPEKTDGSGKEDFEAAFKRVYMAEFGFLLDTKAIIVDDIKVRCWLCIFLSGALNARKVRGIGKTFDTMGDSVYSELETLKQRPVSREKIDSRHSVYFDELGRVNDTPVYLLDNLEVGETIAGPGVVIDATQTILLIPNSSAVLTSNILYITLE
jgi:5-oxoprolinase (ATP-hydrolysing)